MNNNEKTISFADLFRIFLKRLWIILLVAVRVAAATGAVLVTTYTEEYTSKSTLFVMHPEKGLSASSSTHYYEATINTVFDCAELMTSRTVLYSIIDELGLDSYGVTYAGLKSMISISNVPNSHVIEVSVTCGDPDMAKLIVDELCTVGAKQIEDYIEFATAKVIDEGTLNKYPSNALSITFPLLAGIAAAILVFAIFVIVALADDKLNSAAEIEERLGVSVLGVIPYFDGKTSGKKSYYGGDVK